MKKLAGYRTDIDGLRALAVLAVMGFHAFPDLVPGGFVGVDVFFVVSGFLISTILFEDLKSDGIDYRDFYARRIRRIFPALAVVLGTTVAVGAFVEFPDDFRQLGKQAFGGAAFVANFVFIRGQGYFDSSSGPQPLLHLWSLGIEEQFYLAWPVMAALLSRLRAGLLGGMIALAAMSLVASLLLSASYPTLAFYGPASRFWELLAGGLLAYRQVFGGSPAAESARGWHELAGIVGIGLIGLSIVSISRSVVFPGWRALLPVSGAAIVISAGGRSWINRHVLSWKPLAFVGLISYPLYLWHWPALAFLEVACGDVGPAVRAAIMALSAVLAWLTYRWVEQPIRFGALRGIAPAPLCVSIASIAIAGLAVRYGWVANGALNDRLRFVSHFENVAPDYRYIVDNGIARYYRLDCDFYDFLKDTRRESIAPSCYVSQKPRRVMLWGDSFAQSLYHGLRQALPGDVGLLQVATSACRPAIGEVQPDPWRVCNVSNRFALHVIRTERPDVVIVTQRERHEATDWSKVARAAIDAGARHVLVVGPLPEWKPDLNRIIAREYWTAPVIRVSRGLMQAQFQTDRVLKERYSREAPYELVSPIDKLCGPKGCIAYVGPDRMNDLMVFDAGHLTPRGSEWVGSKVLAPVVSRLLRTSRTTEPRTGYERTSLHSPDH